jgi:hypothetical protein
MRFQCTAQPYAFGEMIGTWPRPRASCQTLNLKIKLASVWLPVYQMGAATQGNSMARGKKKRARGGVSEGDLSKGELRKLTALRKSLGDDIAQRAFLEWRETHGDYAPLLDKNAGTITEALQPLIETGKLRIPRGGYILRRGRGRVIIERPEAD